MNINVAQSIEDALTGNTPRVGYYCEFEYKSF